MEIMKTIAQPINELAIWLEETYQVEADQTIAKWHELTGMNITVKEGKVSHNKVESLDVDLTKNVKSKKIPKTKDVCQHIFLSGQKVGEQCTTKPKGGASYCSAHRPKDSAKSPKGTKTSKKREVKKVEKIDSEFGSDSEQEVKVQELKKTKKEKIAIKEPVIEDDDMTEDSDGEPISRTVKYSEAYMDEQEANMNKEKYRKPKPVVAPVIESEDDEEPQKPVKPLLKKKKSVKPQKKAYDTDEEALDKDLNLSDDD